MNKNNYNKDEQQIIQMLTPSTEVKPSADFRQRVLDAAAAQASSQQASATPQRRVHRINYWLGAVCSAAAVIAIAITFTLNTPAYAARKYFSNALITLQDAKTMIMKLSVRTKADEPIDYINPALDYVPATVKVIYDEPMLWSIAKKDGRTLLYKGAEATGNYTYQWIGGQDGKTGWKAEYRGVAGDLAVMLDPRILLEAEYRTAQRNKGTKYEILDLGEVAVVRVSTSAQGNFSQSDYMENTSLAEANTIREYTFAKDSGLLYQMRIMVMVDKKPVPVVESESIIFNEPLSVENLYDKEAFSRVEFLDMEAEPAQASSLTNIPADKAAKIILEAMHNWDMEILNTALHYFKGDVMKIVEARYKGLKLKSIGKSFKSGLYPGYFVECKVILANGKEEKLTLALRNDNKEKVWLIDGGL